MRRWGGHREAGVHSGTRPLVAALTLCVIAAATPAMLVSLSTMRYQADWTTFVLTLATIGFWMGHHRLSARPRAQRRWRQLAFAPALVTAILGPLLAVTSTFGHFLTHNPDPLVGIKRSTGRPG